jgi:hypothetical protein
VVGSRLPWKLREGGRHEAWRKGRKSDHPGEYCASTGLRDEVSGWHRYR